MALVINFFHRKGIFGNLYSDAGVRDKLKIRSHGFGDFFSTEKGFLVTCTVMPECVIN